MTKPNPSALQAVKNVDQDRFISSTGIIDLNLRTKDVAPRSMDAETRDSIHDAVDMVLACVPAEVEALGKLIYAIDDWSLVDRKDMKQLGIAIQEKAAALDTACFWLGRCETHKENHHDY